MRIPVQRPGDRHQKPVRGALAERLAAEQEQLRKRVAAVDEEWGFEQAGTPCDSVQVLGVPRAA